MNDGGTKSGPAFPWRVGLLLPWIFLLGLDAGRAQFNGDFSIEKHALDAENFLDRKTYQAPYSWRHEQRLAPNVFRASVGSLSKKKFYMFQQIRLEKDLGKYASILYRQEQDAFFRPDPIYREVELRFGQGWYASLLGFPEHVKILGHTGVAAAWGKRTDPDRIQLTYLKQFNLYNEETTGTERYSPNPILYRSEFHFYSSENFHVRGNLRAEMEARLLTPLDGKEERYRGRKVDLSGGFRWSERLRFGLDYNGNREERERLPYGAGSSITASAQLLRWGWVDLHGVYSFPGGDVVETGFYRGLFENNITAEVAGDDFEHSMLTDAFYAVWEDPSSDWFHWVYSFQASRVYRSEIDAGTAKAEGNGRTNEWKLGVGIVLQEAGSYRAFFNTSWDLDLLGARQWDGGNIQLQFLF